MSNIILALMENDSPDAFGNDVANAYFQNPAHVRNLLNENCINECVDYVLGNQRVEFDLSDLDLFNEDESLFVKPSRQKGRRKHDKKAVKRKGSAKRFRDRSRKCASEGHMCKMYNRGMVGDWGVRGRRLAETGQVACKTNHRMRTDNCTPFVPDPSVDEMDDVTMTFGDVSMTMNCSEWRNYENQWDAFCNSYAFHELLEKGDSTLWDEYWDKAYEEMEEDLKSGRDLKTNLDKDIKFEELLPNQEVEFCPQELADFMQKLANATPEQRALVRQFFAEKL